MILPDKVYSVLKWLALVCLPAIGTLYFALSGIWGFPYGEEVVGTIMAVCTCIGSIIGVSTYAYNKKLEEK